MLLVLDCVKSPEQSFHVWHFFEKDCSLPLIIVREIMLLIGKPKGRSRMISNNRGLLPN